MNAHEFTINVSELDAAGREYRFGVRAGWVRGALEGHEATTAGTEGALSVRASKSGSDVVVHGTLEAELTVPCARCLEPTRLPIRSDLSVLYVPAAKLQHSGPGGEGELADGEADTLSFEGETIVLDDLVRDELVLEIPMIPLCSEDCAGMSPDSGKGPHARVGNQADGPGDSKPIDPRLAPLQNFAVQSGKKPAT